MHVKFQPLSYMPYGLLKTINLLYCYAYALPRISSDVLIASPPLYPVQLKKEKKVNDGLRSDEKKVSISLLRDTVALK